MRKQPKIRQFGDAVRNVRAAFDFQGLDDNGKAISVSKYLYPVLTFHGTVKCHGTNAGITMHAGKIVSVQSKNRILSFESDNSGFAAWAYRLPPKALAAMTIPGLDGHTYTIFGEWCGGNIQSGVALNQLPKMWNIFDLWVHGEGEDDGEWRGVQTLPALSLNRFSIYVSEQFPSFDITINMNAPELAQDHLVSITEQVEECCPVGATLGVNGAGEGVVWKCTSAGYNDSGSWFKVKGKKHSASKTKHLAPVDIEKVKTVNEFVERVVTENRLNQGLDYMREMNLDIDKKNTGVYLKWISDDVYAEESECIRESGLERKDIGRPLTNKARAFWFGKCGDL